MASKKRCRNFIVRPFWFLVLFLGLLTIVGNLASASAQKVLCRPHDAKMDTSVTPLAHKGSTPPDCTNKCDTCAPCVLVQVEECDPNAHSGYYDMEWGCACNDRIMWPCNEGNSDPPGHAALPGQGQGVISAGKLNPDQKVVPGQGILPDLIIGIVKKPKKGRKHRKHRKHKNSRKIAPGSGK